MSRMKLALIGGGQMGRALLGGMLSGNLLRADEVLVVEPSETGQAWWRANQPDVGLADLAEAIAAADTVLLAVKPNVLPDLLCGDEPRWKGKLVVSIAAGINLESLCCWTGHRRVIRVMPNTPSLVRQGASAYCCASEVSDQDRAEVKSMLACVGLAVEVEDSQMDAVTGLSGSGPAYVCMIIEAMADGGVLAGLPRSLAMSLATQTVLGTASMVAQTGQHPGQLKDAVASPGGTTIAAIATLEQKGLRASLIDAVAVSAAKSKRLGRKE